MRITADIIDEEFVAGCSTSDKVILPEAAIGDKQRNDQKKNTNNPFATQMERYVLEGSHLNLERKEKTYDPLKSCRPECWLRQSILQKKKLSVVRPKTQDLYSSRSASRYPYDPTYSRQQTYRMREMCNKFQDLNLSSGTSSFFDNVRKSCEYANMVCKTTLKMDEVKSNNPKEKVGFETAPAWMVEFLVKMKQEIKDEIMDELSNLPHIERQGHSSDEKEDNLPQREVIHPNVFCDNCDQLIHGIRYKCGNCSDFDLCQECENLPNSHNKNHIFLKIRYPVALQLYRKEDGEAIIIPNAGDFVVSNSRLKHKLERLESKIAYRQSKGMYAARFLWDETIPDGTVLAPSTVFVKSWRVVNCGKKVWNHYTKLKHTQGTPGLTPNCEQVDVPFLRPGEEGVVSILFTTPTAPGEYKSHWNFCHKGRPFGHVVWCHIIVKDIDSEKLAGNACHTVQFPPDGLPNKKEQEVASIAQVLTAVKEEHDRGNLIPRKLAVNSHTATPNNTPFDLTPPKSPDHQAMNELKEVSEEKESIASTQNPDLDQDDDEGSVVSLSSSESDAEFVVIPMPKCFNLSESFSSQNIPHLSQYLQSDTINDFKDLKSSGPKLAKPQNILLKPSYSSETVSQETGVPELSSACSEVQKETEQNIFISHNISPDGSSSEISIIESGDSSPTAEQVVPEISSIHIAVTSDNTPKTNEGVDRREEESSADAQSSSVTFPKFPVEGITSIYEPSTSNTEEKSVQVLPERLVSASVHAAAHILKTARGVISSFQPANTTARSSESVEFINAMDQLTEMGFCNRQQNEELLRKHNNRVALVVAELVNLNDNEWYASRHIPPSPPDYFN